MRLGAQFKIPNSKFLILTAELSAIALRLRPIDEEELFGGSCESGVEPVDVVGGKHFVGHVTLVHIYVRPLTALRLVARHGIRIFYLQGVIVWIGFQLLEAVGL